MAALYLYTRTCSHQAHAVQHNTTNTCGHVQSVIGPECSNDLKGSGLCIIAFRHLLRSASVLNNTEVKGHYSTICRHACFGVLRLISAAWYTSTYVAALYLYTRTCSHQAHAVQHNTTNTCGHAQSVIGPECSNDLKGSGLCIIAFRHLLRSARVLNNTEVKGLIVQSADMHVSAFYASSVQLGTHPHMWLHCIYTRELALTKRMRYNTTQPTHVDMCRAS